ncbi:hypothetical protein NsoK4_06940 [Nitrosopumilus sp. K4]|uniref:hypothetical protein n=1 Tax=Nitrosopumilus sp. K4 TaxID=2795383 RepID=UPI001BA50A41|nr:hypothetical protein [Nitrosopumilus sp. K4]QUC64175.1 hypothetical protein NsoK4_06940 [Nitrosopumilus sp. K4]
MGIDDAIRKLETSNEGLKVIIEHIDDNLADLKLDPKLKDLVDDLENLFYSYLKTWIKSNNDVLEILKNSNHKA